MIEESLDVEITQKDLRFDIALDPLRQSLVFARSCIGIKRWFMKRMKEEPHLSMEKRWREIKKFTEDNQLIVGEFEIYFQHGRLVQDSANGKSKSISQETFKKYFYKINQS